MIGTDGRKLFVYHTPEVQRKVAETVGRFLRQETQKTAFLMETKFVTLSESFFDRMAAGHGETTVYTDIRSPVEAYLHPITGPDGKPRLRTPGASAYWVAKEDIPKLYEGWSRLFDAAEGDTRSDLLTGPKTAAFNGQLGVLLDVAPKQFVTDTVMVGGTRQPVTNTFFEGQAIAGFSLLSWDGKTVDTDVFVEFSKITRVETLHSVPEEIEIRTPHLEKRTLSEKGLRWPVDGMLVLIQGTERLAERTYEYGTPVLNKIPYLNRLFMQRAVGRETTTIYSIITVRLADPLETTALLSARQP
ncbi:MAG TPA: hypothetical protein DEB39_15915 [Planctomycetaceae bacterium]|nr:hypothetical protein [Planctomycetaceae bacterium]